MDNQKIDFRQYLSKENQLKDLESTKIFGNIPIWRIIRTPFRRIVVDFNKKTASPQISPKVFWNIITSFFQLTFLIIFRKHYDNVIFPHPRLYKIDEGYIERLTDPLIDYSNIHESYIIFEYWQNGLHHKPRIHQKNVIYWDFIIFFSNLLSRFFKNSITKKFLNENSQLWIELSKEFNLDIRILNILKYHLASFIIAYKLSAPIIKAIKPKRVFVSPRKTFDYIISICKKNHIPSYELQHGITLDKTILYTGSYNENIDPDYFLTFGKDNIQPLFGIPVEKMINIGFAYKNYLKDKARKYKNSTNKILIISEPHITDSLIEVTSSLAKDFPDYQFDFRCHPQEKLNSEQINKINLVENLREVNNTSESFQEIYKYNIILGENSSVIFEALFLNKKVGRLNFGGLKVTLNSPIKGGTIINSKEEFKTFLENSQDSPNFLNLYSEFKPEIVNNLK